MSKRDLTGRVKDWCSRHLFTRGEDTWSEDD